MGSNLTKVCFSVISVDFAYYDKQTYLSDIGGPVADNLLFPMGLTVLSASVLAPPFAIHFFV